MIQTNLFIKIEILPNETKIKTNIQNILFSINRVWAVCGIWYALFGAVILVTFVRNVPLKG